MCARVSNGQFTVCTTDGAKCWVDSRPGGFPAVCTLLASMGLAPSLVLFLLASVVHDGPRIGFGVATHRRASLLVLALERVIRVRLFHATHGRVLSLLLFLFLPDIGRVCLETR